jgi:hypothetical protein
MTNAKNVCGRKAAAHAEARAVPSSFIRTVGKLALPTVGSGIRPDLLTSPADRNPPRALAGSRGRFRERVS